jgi:hypothetical protein
MSMTNSASNPAVLTISTASVDRAIHDIMNHIAATPSLRERGFFVGVDGEIRDLCGYCPLCALLDEHDLETGYTYPWSGFALLNQDGKLPDIVDTAIARIANSADMKKDVYGLRETLLTLLGVKSV